MEHADKAQPEMLIEVFGERKKIIPSLGTFCRFEKVTGKNPFDPLLWLTPSPSDVVTLFWAALGGDALGKSVDEVADALSVTHIADFKKLLDALFQRGGVPNDPKSDAAG